MVGGAAVVGERFDEAAVVVPVLADIEDLDETDATLDEPPRDETLAPEVGCDLFVDAVQTLRGVAFFR